MHIIIILFEIKGWPIGQPFLFN